MLEAVTALQRPAGASWPCSWWAPSGHACETWSALVRLPRVLLISPWSLDVPAAGGLRSPCFVLLSSVLLISCWVLDMPAAGDLHLSCFLVYCSSLAGHQVSELGL